MTCIDRRQVIQHISCHAFEALFDAADIVGSPCQVVEHVTTRVTCASQRKDTRRGAVAGSREAAIGPYR